MDVHGPIYQKSTSQRRNDEKPARQTAEKKLHSERHTPWAGPLVRAPNGGRNGLHFFFHSRSFHVELTSTGRCLFCWFSPTNSACPFQAKASGERYKSVESTLRAQLQTVHTCRRVSLSRYGSSLCYAAYVGESGIGATVSPPSTGPAGVGFSLMKRIGL